MAAVAVGIDHVERAHRRVEWAARSLHAAAGDLRAANAEGVLVNDPSEAVSAEADRVGGLAREIVRGRERSAGDRRVRHLL
ncbi:MAG TPA: hypothetical protein VEJ23_07135 [Solirubrobacteraceae bacterium]|nr:hypothetical protein [Solirubrobacteraceae bacterium]